MQDTGGKLQQLKEMFNNLLGLNLLNFSMKNSTTSLPLMQRKNEFTNFKQENLFIIEAFKRFDQLARFCLELIPSAA